MLACNLQLPATLTSTLGNSKMKNKLWHYIKRYFYHRTHRMLPDIGCGIGACGQDILVSALLHHKRGGVFVDIGANDGITISNSLYFERELGWNGIAVEPIPSVFDKLQRNRKCTVVHGCVAPRSGKGKFLEVVGGPNL